MFRERIVANCPQFERKPASSLLQLTTAVLAAWKVESHNKAKKTEVKSESVKQS